MQRETLPRRPGTSNTIAVPVLAGDRVLATVGMTYFTSALDRNEILRHVPLVQALADNITASVSSLQEPDTARG